MRTRSFTTGLPHEVADLLATLTGTPMDMPGELPFRPESTRVDWTLDRIRRFLESWFGENWDGTVGFGPVNSVADVARALIELNRGARTCPQSSEGLEHLGGCEPCLVHLQTIFGVLVDDLRFKRPGTKAVVFSRYYQTNVQAVVIDCGDEEIAVPAESRTQQLIVEEAAERLYRIAPYVGGLSERLLKARIRRGRPLPIDDFRMIVCREVGTRLSRMPWPGSSVKVMSH